jgi:hypothetical protein
MKSWQRIMVKAKYRLGKHDPRGALQFLMEALENCPAENRKDMADILFYTGVVLRKLGHDDGAVKSWVMASRLKRFGYGGQMAERMINDYGMPRQETQEEDDRLAFHSVHMARYLQAKTVCRLGSRAEEDMVETLIEEAWCELKESRPLENLSASFKLKIFKETVVIYPLFECPDDFSFADNVLNHDFVQNRRLKPGDSCPCGSGRSYMSCCGRTPSLSEVKNGLF